GGRAVIGYEGEQLVPERRFDRRPPTTYPCGGSEREALMVEHERHAGAAAQGAGLAEEMRAHVRFVGGAGVKLRLAVRPVYRGHLAMLRDISAGGVGLLMNQPLQAGQTIAVELRGSPEEGTSRLARV